MCIRDRDYGYAWAGVLPAGQEAAEKALEKGCEAVSYTHLLSDAEAQRFGTGKEEIGKCPRCGSPVYVGKGNFYCSNKECSLSLIHISSFPSRTISRRTPSFTAS